MSTQENSLPVPANDRREGEAQRGPHQPVSTQDPHTHLTDRRIELCPISRLTPYKNNARTHSKKQIKKIASSIKRFGFNNPVLVDDAGEIIAGTENSSKRPFLAHLFCGSRTRSVLDLKMEGTIWRTSIERGGVRTRGSGGRTMRRGSAAT
jgi:ParB-like nuclease family protein